MPNVLVFGANGYLGFTICQALVRSGNHEVWGLVRSAGKGDTLALNEIHPVIGDVTKPETFTALVESVPIDVVIDTTSAYESAGEILKAVAAASKARLEKMAHESRPAAPKLGYIYCSGMWVHGSGTSDFPANDLESVGTSLSKGQPGNAMGWRTGMEQAVLASRDVLDVAIIRPAVLYGRSSYIWGAWWRGLLKAAGDASAGSVKIPATKEARSAMTHVDDVAAGFVLAAEKVHGLLGSWPVFDLHSETVSIGDMIEGVQAALDVKVPVEFIGTGGDPFMEAMNTRNNVTTSRAKTVLGWEPQRKDFVLNLPLYVKAFATAQKMGVK